MNAIFFVLVAIAFAVGVWRQLSAPAGADAVSPMQAIGSAAIEQAGAAVTLAVGLIGVMALFLGLMKVAEAGGLLVVIARLVRPLMHRLFPEVPPQHPAMGAMIFNISANVLGLGNAATPFGIRAMEHLKRLAPVNGVATNAMVLFLAINTSSVTLLPTSVIALRAAAGSADPAGILPTTLFATICSTATAIVVAMVGARFSPMPTADAAMDVPSPATAPATLATPADGLSTAADAQPGPSGPLPSVDGAERPYPAVVSLAVLAAVLSIIPLTILYGKHLAPWLIPVLIIGLLAFGVGRGVRVYEAFVDGARDAFDVAVRIIPYLVAILVAVAMVRASGAIDLFIQPVGAVTERVGLPTEALIMALLRTLSGSGAFGYLASVLADPSIGPDSYTGYLLSTIQGSTETTFYVLAVYFGSVGVVRFRHAIVAGLLADLMGVVASVFICWFLYGPAVP